MSEPGEVQGLSPAAAPTSAESGTASVLHSYVAMARLPTKGARALKTVPPGSIMPNSSPRNARRQYVRKIIAGRWHDRHC
jgi:hypothetical protein